MEWIDDIDDPNDHHRHCSQLVGLYPGKEINKDTKELFDAAKVSLVQRSDEGTGWSMANKINLWARLLDADHAHNLLGNLLREHVNDNLFDEHPPFQIDGNFGATSAVAEILVQSHMGYISIIPSLPNKQYWKSGSFTGIRARGNFEVSASWTDGKLVEAKIKSNAGKDLVIEHPGASKMEIYDGAGNRLEKKVLGNDRISVSTVAYEVYTFK